MVSQDELSRLYDSTTEKVAQQVQAQNEPANKQQETIVSKVDKLKQMAPQDLLD